jgi:hypothetical protein
LQGVSVGRSGILREELAGPQDADHRFLALLGRDHNLDLALLDVENSVRDSRLQEDHFVLA